jgi:hypothetical protein
MPLTRDEILGRKLGCKTITLPSGGEVVVRGLTRNEALGIQSREGMQARDNYVIAAGLVVDPPLTEAEVADWSDAATAGDLMAISEAISELSGMTPSSAKGATKSVRRRR